MLGREGQRRALHGLTQNNGDHLILLHGKTELIRWPADPGFPTLDNRDAGNPGRGQHVATWRATIPAATVLGNVADSVTVVDHAGAIVAAEAFPTPVHKPEGVAVLVYVNEHIVAQ